MRLAHDYVVTAGDERPRTTLDQSPSEFGERLGYREGRFSTREELLAAADGDWEVELRHALRELLDPARRTLSVGSGFCEHEVPLVLEGYPIVASDVVDEAMADAARLFPELETRRFDVLDPEPGERFDDVLIASLDYAFDDGQLERALVNVRTAVLAPEGRLIFVQRYQDTLGTRLVDLALAPLLALAMRAKARLGGGGQRIVRRQHGFRRRRGELRELARRAGFRVGRVRYAGFGVELTRVDLHRRLPPLYRLIARIDRRLRTFNNATVLELIPDESAAR